MIAEILLSSGYKVAQEFYSESFGASFVKLAREDVEFKIISDKSIVSIEVQNKLWGKWIDLNKILQLISKRPGIPNVRPYSNDSISIDNLAKIENLMSKENYATTIRKISQEPGA